MLGTRVLTGLSLIAVLVLVLCLDEWLAPWFPLWFLVASLAMSVAAYELVGLLNETGARPTANSVIGGVLAVVVSNWVPHLTEFLRNTEQLSGIAYETAEPVNVLAWPLLTFVGVVMASFVIQGIQFVKPGRTMATIAANVLAVAYIGLLGSFTIQMRWLEGRFHGLIPLVFLFATAKGADTGAYTLGRLLGRHKLWPSLSPNKTVEGAVGGLIFSIGAASLVAALARQWLSAPSLDWRQAIGYGIVVGVVAQLGDLMESMIKRDCARKDASDAVPGFGGVLDVLDSLLFAGPVAYGFWLWMGP